MADEQYATTPEHWELMQEVLRHKIDEREIDTSNIPAVFDLIREYWLLLNDEEKLRAYCAQRRLAILQTQRDAEDAARVDVDQEIADLEAELGGN